MNAYAAYYTEKLYPLQNGALKLVRECNLPFYLTGGTAISRQYCQHRFSDDLNFFLNRDPNYPHYIDQFFHLFSDKKNNQRLRIDLQHIIRTSDYTQFFIYHTHEPDIQLKIDLVNDTTPHFGDFEYNPILGKIDSWRNMLSNKITALYRYEPKDIVDIWGLSKKFNFNWPEIIAEAAQKESPIDPIIVTDILSSFPEESLETIKWINPSIKTAVKRDLDKIINNIITGTDNIPI